MLASGVLFSVEMGIVLLAACVLVGPLLAERLRMPGLVGLIAIGMLLGPSVLEWLRPSGFVATVGVAGLLYLMFLAGLELDLKTFVANRTAAITFGVLTFAIPFALGVAAALWVLGLDARAAALVGAMWASHTIVAYPEVKLAGLDRNRAVGVAVAATVITDIAALVVLAVAASSGAEEAGTSAAMVAHSTGGAPLPLWAGLVLVTVFCLAVLPRLTRWVFANVFVTRTQRFVWLLAGMAGGATVALLGGIEGLVGAFLAGIGMNRSVPARSELMERVEFVGNALLVPAFLVSIGLSIDPRALIEPSTLATAGLFITVVVTGKLVAAMLAGRMFRFSAAETALMATLTIGQAAATLAIAQVGTATGLFDQEILDAAVVTVVASVLVTSFGTRWAARQIEHVDETRPVLGEHVLALAPAAELAGPTASIMTAVAAPDRGLITPFVVDVDGLAGASDRAGGHARREAFDEALARCGADTNPITRVGVTTAAATLTLARESQASLVVVPTGGSRFPLALDADDEIDAIGADALVPCLALRLQPGGWKRIIAITGTRRDPAALVDTNLAADLVTRLVDADKKLPVVVLAPSPRHADPFERIEGVTVVGYKPRSGDVLDHIEPDDLVVAPAHVVADAGMLARVRVWQTLRKVSVAVIGGPGRLRVSMTRSHRPLIGAVGERG